MENQSNSGGTYYYDKSVYDRDKELQEHEIEKLCLPKVGAPYVAKYYEQIFSMTEEELDKLTIDDCNKYEYILASYGLFIKRAANIENSRIIYLQNKISNIIGPVIQRYSGNWEMQKAAAIADDVAAKKFNEDLIYAKQKYARLEDIHFGINNLAEKFKNFRFIKQQEYNNG